MQIEVTGKEIRVASLSLALISGYCLKHGDSNHSIYAIYLALLLLSVLPWLLVLRRKISNTPFSEGGKWMKIAKASLWITLLIGPVVTGISWLWFIATTEPVSAARSWTGPSVFLYAVLSLSAAYYFAAFAYVIQLWRDQWHPKLNVVTAIFLTLVFLAYCWFMYDQG